MAFREFSLFAPECSNLSCYRNKRAKMLFNRLKPAARRNSKRLAGAEAGGNPGSQSGET
jgi:hypothetical protein